MAGQPQTVLFCAVPTLWLEIGFSEVQKEVYATQKRKSKYLNVAWISTRLRQINPRCICYEWEDACEDTSKLTAYQFYAVNIMQSFQLFIST